MLASKAIKLLENFDELLPGIPFIDHRNAIKLGIEALKRHKALQENPHYTLLGLLPSETPEGEKG